LAENAALLAENRLLRELVERLDRDKDAWKAQAERLALAPPRRSWWWFRQASWQGDHQPFRRWTCIWGSR